MLTLQKQGADDKQTANSVMYEGPKTTHKIHHNVIVWECAVHNKNTHHVVATSTCTHYENTSIEHCKHIHTGWNGCGLWMICYLVISRKLRRVERSSRRLICLWHWLQKKSSASSLRKLWKQSGRGAGALERGKKGGRGGGSGEWRTRRWERCGGGCTEVGKDTSEVLVTRGLNIALRWFNEKWAAPSFSLVSLHRSMCN